MEARVEIPKRVNRKQRQLLESLAELERKIYAHTLR